MAKLQVFKSFDKAIFNKLDQLQQQPQYTKITDSYASAEDNIQEIIKAALMLIVTVIPLIFLLFFANNSSLTSELETKENMMITANELIQIKQTINREEKNILGSTFIDSENAFKNKVSSILSLSAIDTEKVKVFNFSSDELDSGIVKSSADIDFKEFSSNDLYAALDTLVSKGKLRIDEVSIKKSQNTNLLSGVVTLIYFSKDTNN